MRSIGIIFSIFLMHFATAAWSASSFQCYPNLEVSWSFDQTSNKSEFYENTENLSSITLYLDSGFLKLPAVEKNRTKLFRQNSIIKNSDDPMAITVRYESAETIEMEKTSIFIIDPVCKLSGNAQLSILTTAEMGYKNVIYTCNCLSQTHDNKAFVYDR
jgi:hypothetical protein